MRMPLVSRPILLNNDHYELVRQQHNEEKNLPFANPAALIPLKARAWLGLTESAAQGETGKSKEIAKHRTDVFGVHQLSLVREDRRLQVAFKRI